MKANNLPINEMYELLEPFCIELERLYSRQGITLSVSFQQERPYYGNGNTNCIIAITPRSSSTRRISIRMDNIDKLCFLAHVARHVTRIAREMTNQMVNPPPPPPPNTGLPADDL